MLASSSRSRSTIALQGLAGDAGAQRIGLRVEPRRLLTLSPQECGHKRRAIAEVGSHGGSGVAGAAPAPRGCRPCAGDSEPGARPRRLVRSPARRTPTLRQPSNSTKAEPQRRCCCRVGHRRALGQQQLVQAAAQQHHPALPTPPAEPNRTPLALPAGTGLLPVVVPHRPLQHPLGPACRRSLNK